MTAVRWIALICVLLGLEAASARFDDPCERFLDDEKAKFVAADPAIEARMVWGMLERFWREKLGLKFKPSTLIIYNKSTHSGCGKVLATRGPIYCPVDHYTYVDLSWWDTLRKIKAPDAGARVFALAHEYSHHIQNLLGLAAPITIIKDSFTSASDRADFGNTVGKMHELWADALAGMFLRALFESGRMNSDDIVAATGAASRVGDDYLFAALGDGELKPSPVCFTHGSGQERMTWTMIGFNAKDPNLANPFFHSRFYEGVDLELKSQVQNLFTAHLLKPPF